MRGVRRALLAVTASVSACSLGLDASKINDAGSPTPDGGGPPPPPVDATVPPDAALPDVGVDAAPTVPNATCATDADCAAAGACIGAGTCDPVSHVCVDPICASTNGCQAQVCNTLTNTCGAALQVGFFAGSFPVSAGGVGCGG